MILVKLLIAVTLSQSYGARVLKPNEPTVTKEVKELVTSFQSLWQCNEKKEYLRGVEDGRKQLWKEFAFGRIPFSDDDDNPDSEFNLK